ncbi:MAG: class I SAM-dependent methyltransferase, partial [Gammaproteobacteria bacterium]|nr:class I SAM-dependent methyltransferase [Gammaproteobacteria bacterium]
MNPSRFKDHFSAHASDYAEARPRYPEELFAWLAERTAGHDAAWDCGTGNGQAALGLAAYYARVVATDPSAKQISNAFPHPRVTYRVTKAESRGLPAQSMDLVTAAQAAHWFELPRFYDQARSVLKPQGVIAIWCYGLCCIDPAIDAVVQEFYSGEIAAYWPPERALIDDGYRSLDFPFQAIPPPPLQMRHAWTLSQFLAYLRTWSAVQKFMDHKARDPVPALRTRLEKLWGKVDASRDVIWP